MSSHEARDGLGSLLRKVREKKGLDRETLAQRTGLQVEVIVKLEHGVVNPTRSDFQKIIVALALSKKLRGKAGQLLGIIHPRRKRKVKFHLHSSVLQQRSRRRGYRGRH